MTIRLDKWSGSVTLTTANTNYSLRDLINAVMVTQGLNGSVPEYFREVNIQAFGGIDGGSGNSNDVLIGDSHLTTSNFGYLLHPGESRLYRCDHATGNFTDIYVRTAGSAQVLNIDYMGF